MAARPDLDTLPPVQRRWDARGQIAALVDRLESGYRQQFDVNPDLLTWLEQRPAFRHQFWLAIDPLYDHPVGVIAVLDRLRQERPATLERYHHLAIALAVVHDQSQAMASSRYFMMWGMEASQWQEMPDLLSIWDWYTDPSRGRLWVIPPEQLIWPLLVHVVDNDLPDSQRRWAVNRFTGQRNALAALYGLVRYDNDKLERKTPKIGSRPYTLGNLYNPAYGGVCVDQAYASSRVMKTFGVPALKMLGDDRYGIYSHAWTSFLDLRGGPKLLDTGRYSSDYYWTGQVFDPQRQIVISDREMLMMLDGAGRDFARYSDALALARMARSLGSYHPDTALAMLREAINTSAFCQPAWFQLADLYTNGHLSDAQVEPFLRVLNRLRAHPDITLAFMQRIMQRFAQGNPRRRVAAYQALLPLYGARPDLQIRLGQDLCWELFEGGFVAEGARAAMGIIKATANPGRLVLPLIEQLVEACRESPPAVQGRVRTFLNGIAEGPFPRSRGDQVSTAYETLCEIIDSL